MKIDLEELEWHRELRDGRWVEVATLPKKSLEVNLKPLEPLENREYRTNESVSALLVQLDNDLSGYQDFHDRVVAKHENAKGCWLTKKQAK